MSAPPSDPVSRAVEQQPRDDEEVDLVGGHRRFPVRRLGNPSVAGLKGSVGIYAVQDQLASGDTRIRESYAALP